MEGVQGLGFSLGELMEGFVILGSGRAGLGFSDVGRILGLRVQDGRRSCFDEDAGHDIRDSFVMLLAQRCRCTAAGLVVNVVAGTTVAGRETVQAV